MSGCTVLLYISIIESQLACLLTHTMHACYLLLFLFFLLLLLPLLFYAPQHVCFFSESLQDVVHRACNTPTDSRDRPLEDVRIEDCGSLPVGRPFRVDKEAAIL